MTSYGVAEEGTNTLYIGLIELVAQRDTVHKPYSLTEIEMLLNYFPHNVWQDVGTYDMTSLRERFYGPILRQLELFWDVLTNA